MDIISNLSIEFLFIVLLVLFLLSAFFSGSETALMSINKYRMRHQAKLKNKGALAAVKLLDNPDKLIGVILLGNNLTNILITQLATILALKLYGDIGLAIATGFLTIFILIFAELAPKTVGVIHSEKIAYPSALIYKVMLFIFYPLIFLINLISNGLLRIIGVSHKKSKTSLSSDELKTFIKDAGSKLSKQRLSMLESIIDLEKSTIEDIIIPRNEIYSINTQESIEEIIRKIKESPYTRILVYEKNIDNTLGILHLKKITPVLIDNKINLDEIRNLINEPYFIAEGTSLYNQLLNFQKEKRRLGIVVDEYGDIIGMATLDDILEEIVGDFTSEPNIKEDDIEKQDDGSFVVDGGVHIKDINNIVGSNFKSEDSKTINGLLLEHIGTIPKIGTKIRIDNYMIEIIEILDNSIDKVKIESI